MIKQLAVKWVLSAVCVAFLMTGCESGEGDDSLSDTGSGSTTVSGVLDSISSDYVPAAVQGITVDLVQDGKTILRTVTKADGSFTFYGVPAGAFTLVFHIQGQELTRPLTVEETADGTSSANVVLGKVEVSAKGTVDEVVEVEAKIEVTVAVEPAAPAGPAAPAFNVGTHWNFSWNGTTETLALTQAADGALSGTLGENYTVTGSISGSQVKLVFTPATAAEKVVTQDNQEVKTVRVVIQTATGTAEGHSLNGLQSVTSTRAKPISNVLSSLPPASSMSGTWTGTGTPVNSDYSWHASPAHRHTLINGPTFNIDTH